MFGVWTMIGCARATPLSLSPNPPPSEGGRGGNRDQPGASMSQREGSLGKGLRTRRWVPEGSRNLKGWQLGSGSTPPLGQGGERPGRGKAGSGVR